MTPARKPKTALYFSNVAALAGDEAIVAGHLVAEGSEPTGTVLLRCGKTGWGAVSKVDDVVYHLVTVQARTFAAIGRRGAFLMGDRASIAAREHAPISGFGYLESVGAYAGTCYVCGADRQVLERRADGTWGHIDEGIAIDATTPSGQSFLDIAAGPPATLLAVGTGGLAAVLQGGKWSSIDLPTNVDLHCVVRNVDGTAFVAGGGGTLFRIDANGEIDDLSLADGAKVSFRDACMFQGRLYLAAGPRLFSLHDDQLEPVDLPPAAQGDFCALSASESLWCVGDEWVRQFDGRKWLVHECPANQG